MANVFNKFLGLGLIGVGVTPFAMAQTLEGRVTDASGEAPLQGAIVSVEGADRTTTTDRAGRYRINNLSTGSYNVIVSYIGTDPVRASVVVPEAGAVLNLTLGENVRLLDNVLVVGSAAAQAGAINQQRASDAIISVIDSDGLGNFPDTTVADSLQRVPGLSIENDQGEGRYVSIRGLNTDLVSTSINGVRTPSPEDRRGIALDGVPSDLLDGITVQKSLTPNVDGDSLGGVIDLKTISAFDRNGRFIRAKVEGRWNEISEEVSPKVTLTYADTLSDQFGFALSLNYQDLRIESHNNEVGEWDIAGGNAFIGDEYEQRWYGLNRERLGLVANFDFRPTENTDLYLRTFFNDYADDEIRNVFQYRDLDDAEDDGVLGPTSTIVPLNETQAEVRQRRETRKIQTLALGGETFMDQWNFQYEMSYAYAEEDDSDNHDIKFRFKDIQDAAADAGLANPNVLIDFSSPETPRITGDILDLVFDPSNYFLDEFEEEKTRIKDTEYSARFDISRDSLIGNTPVVWQAGMKLRDREKVRDVNKFIYEADDFSLSPYVAGDFIPGWRLDNPMPFWPDAGLTSALRGATNPALELDEEKTFFDSNSEDFTVDEKILAGYAMGTFRFGQLTVIAGARIEDTTTDLSGITVAEDDDTLSLRNVSNDYTHVLPSLNLKYEFNDKLIARGAYYAAVVRPSFGEMAPFTWFNDDRDELEIGNPNLDPYEADNFDLSLEYYPDGVSVISVGLFQKQIDNAIYPITFDLGDNPGIDLSYLSADQLATVEEVSTFINVGSSKLTGVEFNYVQDLGIFGDTFEGFLASANLTLTDSKATLPDGRDVRFLAQADTVWNVALGYDRGPWDVRLSANFRGDYIDSLEDEDFDRFTDDRLLVEASVKYDVNDILQVYLEGKNLTDEPEYYYFGDERRLSQYDEFGRSVIAGVRLTF
jgi:TonB-dependent receptor